MNVNEAKNSIWATLEDVQNFVKTTEYIPLAEVPFNFLALQLRNISLTSSTPELYALISAIWLADSSVSFSILPKTGRPSNEELLKLAQSAEYRQSALRTILQENPMLFRALQDLLA